MSEQGTEVEKVLKRLRRKFRVEHSEMGRLSRDESDRENAGRMRGEARGWEFAAEMVANELTKLRKERKR